MVEALEDRVKSPSLKGTTPAKETKSTKKVASKSKEKIPATNKASKAKKTEEETKEIVNIDADVEMDD